MQADRCVLYMSYHSNYICIDITQCVPGCAQGVCILTQNICQCYPSWSGATCDTGF